MCGDDCLSMRVNSVNKTGLVHHTHIRHSWAIQHGNDVDGRADTPWDRHGQSAKREAGPGAVGGEVAAKSARLDARRTAYPSDP